MECMLLMGGGVRKMIHGHDGTENIPLNANGVGSLLTKWRLEPCSGLRAEPGHTGENKGKREKKKRRRKERSEGGLQFYSVIQ